MPIHKKVYILCAIAVHTYKTREFLFEIARVFRESRMLRYNRNVILGILLRWIQSNWLYYISEQEIIMGEQANWLKWSKSYKSKRNSHEYSKVCMCFLSPAPSQKKYQRNHINSWDSKINVVWNKYNILRYSTRKHSQNIQVNKTSYILGATPEIRLVSCI